MIVFVVFRIADNRLPWILALSATYAIGAYVILPRVASSCATHAKSVLPEELQKAAQAPLLQMLELS